VHSLTYLKWSKGAPLIGTKDIYYFDIDDYSFIRNWRAPVKLRLLYTLLKSSGDEAGRKENELMNVWGRTDRVFINSLEGWQRTARNSSWGKLFLGSVLFCIKKNEPGSGAEPHYLIILFFIFFCYFLRGQKVTKNPPRRSFSYGMFQSCTVNSRNRSAFGLEFLTRALPHIPKMIERGPINYLLPCPLLKMEGKGRFFN